ncbi:MAG: alpha/beta hydrolase [Bdellovibrionaceae bacterium]|nr:alpha/beta hydrolase [Pseudobdellovibrionaceae bacterium]
MYNWIFIRGWGRGVAHWSDFLTQVQNAFPQDHFEFLELPGNGALHKLSSPLTINETVRIMRQNSQFVTDGKKIKLVGISLGGMIVTEWAREFPQEVEMICLINSSSANHGRFYERLLLSNAPKFLKLARQKDLNLREMGALEIVSNSSDRRKLALPSWVKETSIHPVSPRNLIRQLLAAFIYRFPKSPPVKAFLVGSVQDRMVSVRCTERLAADWKCPLFLHPWAGHDLPLDDPEWMINCLKKMH